MKKALRVVGWLGGILGVVVLGCLIYFGVAYPRKQEPPDVRIEATPQLLARGEYLFRDVAVCAECHTPRRPDLAGEAIDEEELGAGGNPFPLGSAGTLYAKNITPAGIGEWSDGEIVRALRDGVSRDGSALFPLMPYYNYRQLSERDLHALVAYTRTLDPRPSRIPERQLKFPMKLIIRLMPSPGGEYPAEPPRTTLVEYGRYLVTAASCGDCHSPMDDRGQPVAGREFSGGSPFPTGDGWVAYTSNITPDSATGIGAWSRERFIGAFKAREPERSAPRPRAPDERSSPMPWLAYAGMTEEDLGAIYDYLRTLEPVRHEVVRYAREVSASE
ncbi:MAG TPA: c-type cytochrome [Gemmatimonadota bacterium]|nr:c-type cytochrome [Gemmatimonadota bacterium]